MSVILKLSGVSKRFGSLLAIDNLSMHLNIGLVRAKAEAIYFNGKAIGGNPTHRIVAQGISIVPVGRCLFSSLSVEENLSVGSYSKRPLPWNLYAVYSVFPMIKDRRHFTSTSFPCGHKHMSATYID